MNILIYQPRCSYYVGGGEIVPLEQAKFLSKLGHNVSMMVSKGSFIEESNHFIKFKEDNPSIKIIYIELDDYYKDIYALKPGMNQFR